MWCLNSKNKHEIKINGSVISFSDSEFFLFLKLIHGVMTRKDCYVETKELGTTHTAPSNMSKSESKGLEEKEELKTGRTVPKRIKDLRDKIEGYLSDKDAKRFIQSGGKKYRITISTTCIKYSKNKVVARYKMCDDKKINNLIGRLP